MATPSAKATPRDTVLTILTAHSTAYSAEVQSALAEIERLEQEQDAGIFDILRRHDIEQAQARLEQAQAKNTAICDAIVELRSKHLI